MNIRLTFAPYLGIDKNLNGTSVEVADNATVSDVIEALSIDPKYKNHVIPMVNDTARKPEDRLKEGDTVHLFLPVAGG